VATVHEICLIGPLPPPSGGMANQCKQLSELLQLEGLEIQVLQVNAPYKPKWVSRFWGIRAIFRLVPFLYQLWLAAGKVQLFHVMANSGWSWFLFAAPAVWIAKLRGIPVIINYRGGSAAEFFKSFFFIIKPTLKAADSIVVPSFFLQNVFEDFGFSTIIVPNIINTELFTPHVNKKPIGDSLHIIVTRNLEHIYDISTALRAFKIVKQKFPYASLTIAGSGPLRQELEALSSELALSDSVNFTGRIDNEKMHKLYQEADIMVNASLVDNMPISILEALASGVPVVSTNVGGIPFLVDQGKTSLLVGASDPIGMAKAIMDIATNPSLAKLLSHNGLERAKEFSWPRIRLKWLQAYQSLIENNN
jgi:glycosyltransferase involved in cell wall biosynthesis